MLDMQWIKERMNNRSPGQLAAMNQTSYNIVAKPAHDKPNSKK